jgi:phage-related tail fiber protein
MSELGVIITDVGEALLNNAGISGTELKLQKFSIGDGGVAANYNPTYAQLKALTSIPGEWDKRNLTEVYPNPEGPGYIAEGFVPHDVGANRWCRIVGYWTESGKLFAVHTIPEWLKPAANGPMMYELPLKAYFVHSSEATITLSVNPSLQAATQSWVNARYATKQELTDAVSAVEARLSQPPVLEAPGAMPAAGDAFIQATGNYQLQKSPENSLLVVVVSPGIEPPHLVAPEDEKVKSIKGDHDSIRLVTYGQPYRFLRKQNAWRQL